MRRRTILTLLAGAGLILAVDGAALATTASSHGNVSAGGAFVSASRHQVLPRHGGTVDSLNWSGYAVTPSAKNVTAVSSTFVVPSAGLLPPGFAATWTGIGGYNTSDLIQAGVEENSLPSNPLLGAQYSAWYEVLPASETPISGCHGAVPSCAVSPGQTVSVSITQTSTADVWDINMSDGSHWTWSKTVNYKSSHASAEWILEAPSLVAQTLLAGVGTVHFGPINTFTTSGGPAQTVASGAPTTIDLSPGLIDEATPSKLGPNGQSFNDCAYEQSCGAPKA